MQQQQERETTEIRQRIESVRNKRLLNEKLIGHSISEIQDEEESATDWIRRTKLNNNNSEGNPLFILSFVRSVCQLVRHLLTYSLTQVKAKQSKEKQLEQQQEYNAQQLKGLKVMHDSKSLDTGSEIILTLADSNVLDIDEATGKIRGINEDDDILENVNIAADERRLHTKKEMLRSKRPLYSGTQ